MANKIVFDDGKEVELSKETTERLRKELLKPKRIPIVRLAKNSFEDDRVLLNIPDEFLADKFKGCVLCLIKSGYRANKRPKDNDDFDVFYSNVKEIF